MKFMEELYHLPECPATELEIDSFVLCDGTTLEALQLAVAHGAKIDYSFSEVACAGRTSAGIVKWLHQVLFSIPSKETTYKCLVDFLFDSQTADDFIDIHCWKLLASYGLKPTSVNALKAVHSRSHSALETTRFLLEELNCPHPEESKYHRQLMQKDVLGYLKQRGMLTDK